MHPGAIAPETHALGQCAGPGEDGDDQHRAVAAQFELQVVDRALDLSGGAGIFKRSRIEQLFRDCRLGRIHPANEMLAHEVVGKLSLGINPDDPQRWG